MFNSVRIRLTIWYAGVLALSLIVFAFLVYYGVSRSFYRHQDASLRSTAQTLASVYLEELEEERSVVKANDVVLREMVFPNRYVEVVDASGKAMAWSGNLNGAVFSIPPEALNLARQSGGSYIVIGNLRVAVVPLSPNQELGFAAVAEPLSVVDDALRGVRRDFIAGVPLILLLATAGGYFLAVKSLSPITLMNRQLHRITADNLSARLDVTNSRDELGRLTTNINELLERLETSFQEQQRFVADASHELRTPLAILRGETDVALEKERGPEDYRQSLFLIREEAERLSRIVDDLFILAHGPIDERAVRKEQIDFSAMVADCVRAAQVLAARKDLRLEMKTDPALSLAGDDELLKRMILNLLDNAVKYTPAGGEISVHASARNGNVRMVVRDSGIGISEKDQLHIFDRFYRVDKARSRALGGAGLGLSIVNWIVKVHGGDVSVRSAPGDGSAFVVELPAS